MEPRYYVHRDVLAALDRLGALPADTTAGRRRILERHTPAGTATITYCVHCHPRRPTGADPVMWPCHEYVDAAADLLPTDPS
jgi:cytochrome c553